MARPNLSLPTAARIIAHIRDKGLAPGEHLPAQGLADVLRLSRAPVSAALKRMAEEGIVRLEPHRGYFLAKAPDEIASPLAVATASAEPEDEVYARIVEDCLSGRMPERVSENELMRLHSLPRSALLKILSRIQAEGWADRRPGGGWEFLAGLRSRDAYEDAYQFRASVESQALLLPSFAIDREAFLRARGEQEDILSGGFERMGRARLFELNSRFHEMLVGCAGNAFFTDALVRVNRLRRLLEYRATVDRSRLPLQSKEHLLILDMIEAGELARASAFLKAHILGAGAIKSPTVGS